MRRNFFFSEVMPVLLTMAPAPDCRLSTLEALLVAVTGTFLTGKIAAVLGLVPFTRLSCLTGSSCVTDTVICGRTGLTTEDGNEASDSLGSLASGDSEVSVRVSRILTCGGVSSRSLGPDFKNMSSSKEGEPTVDFHFCLLALVMLVEFSSVADLCSA